MRKLFRLGFVLACFVSVTAPAIAGSIDTIAKQAFLIDMTTGTVLFEKNADERMPTSSMSKVMTMHMVFERLKSGRLSLDDTMPVSEAAWRMQGSKTWVELGNQVRVEDLIRGVIIQSGNDASIVLAEGLEGSEGAFAEKMTEKARELGMMDSHFMNATGWPDENHYSTVRDLAILAQHLIQEYPEYYHYYSEKEFTYHGIKQGNRNPLLYRNMNVDGIKTGHTEAAGFGLMASAERNNRRLVLVVNGLPDMQARADESARLLEWGFREFESYPLFKAGEIVEQADVWMGEQATVPLTLERNLSVTMNRDERKGMAVKIAYDAPLKAPIAKGTQVGRIVITAPTLNTVEIPLIAAESIAELGFFGRVMANAQQFVSNLLN